jgi:hypothetical protein
MSYVFIYDAILEDPTAVWDEDRGKERLKNE